MSVFETTRTNEKKKKNEQMNVIIWWVSAIWMYLLETKVDKFFSRLRAQMSDGKYNRFCKTQIKKYIKQTNKKILTDEWVRE